MSKKIGKKIKAEQPLEHCDVSFLCSLGWVMQRAVGRQWRGGTSHVFTNTLKLYTANIILAIQDHNIGGRGNWKSWFILWHGEHNFSCQFHILVFWCWQLLYIINRLECIFAIQVECAKGHILVGWSSTIKCRCAFIDIFTPIQLWKLGKKYSHGILFRLIGWRS